MPKVGQVELRSRSRHVVRASGIPASACRADQDGVRCGVNVCRKGINIRPFIFWFLHLMSFLDWYCNSGDR